MVFVGIDLAEAHHDVCVVDEVGSVLGKRRVPEGLEGVRQIHELVGAHAEQPEQVVVGIETDRGLLIGALVAAGYQIYAINPLSVSRYRERHVTSRAKSDPADAKVLADLVRTDRHNHRPVAGDSGLAEVVKVLARGHQDLVWSRQRFVNRLRNTLREFYPAALQSFKDLRLRRGVGRAGASAHTRCRPLAHQSQDRFRASPWRPPAQSRGAGSRDPGGAPL